MPFFAPPTTRSRLLPGPERIRTSIYTEGDKLIDRPNEKINTFYDVMVQGRELSQGGCCLGYRTGSQQQYVWMNYDQVFEYAKTLASGLVKLGFEASNKTMIGIHGINNPEWMITHFACVANSMISVPLYHTFDQESLKHILEQTELEIVFCDTEQRLSALIELSKKAKLKYFILMKINGEFSDEIKKNYANDKTIKLLTFNELLQLGKSNLKEFQYPKPEDVYMICYTSGTTGNAKGVVMTHRSFIAGMVGITTCFDHIPINSTDRLISFLPLAHVYEQLMEASMLYYGASIGYYAGNVLKLMDDAQELQPTVFPLVPRLLNRLVSQIQKTVSDSGLIRQAMFSVALNRKMAAIDRGEWVKDTIWDNYVFKRIQSILGGHVRLITTGSAPISPEILKFARAVFGAVLLEGYGQTECGGLATASLAGDASVGHVGAPAVIAQIKLIDVPELEYFADKNQGEVCIRGPGLMKEYFKEPEKTAEALDSDGWLHTGDIGCWTPEGCLKIIDRRKHIFKLSQGDYVAPEKIESLLSKCPVISQIYVDGDSLQNYLVAIVVPEEKEIRKCIQTQSSLENEDFDTLCKNDFVKSYVLSKIQETSVESGLTKIEQVKAVYLCSEAFSPENDLLTPTMKNRRPQLRKRFKDIIEKLYRDTKDV